MGLIRLQICWAEILSESQGAMKAQHEILGKGEPQQSILILCSNSKGNNISRIRFLGKGSKWCCSGQSVSAGIFHSMETESLPQKYSKNSRKRWWWCMAFPSYRSGICKFQPSTVLHVTYQVPASYEHFTHYQKSSLPLILDTWETEIAYEFAEIIYDSIPGFASHGNFMFDSQFPWLTQKPGDKSWETALMESTTVSWFSSPVTSKRLRNTKRGTVQTMVIHNQSKIQKSNVQTPGMTSHYAGLFIENPYFNHWLIIIPYISE